MVATPEGIQGSTHGAAKGFVTLSRGWPDRHLTEGPTSASRRWPVRQWTLGVVAAVRTPRAQRMGAWSRLESWRPKAGAEPGHGFQPVWTFDSHVLVGKGAVFVIYRKMSSPDTGFSFPFFERVVFRRVRRAHGDQCSRTRGMDRSPRCSPTPQMASTETAPSADRIRGAGRTRRVARVWAARGRPPPELRERASAR